MESVDTKTLSNNFEFFAAIIEYAINGCFLISAIFLLFTLSEPDLAGIRAIIFFF